MEGKGREDYHCLKGGSDYGPNGFLSSYPDLRVTNVLVAANLNCTIDLDYLSRSYGNTIYDPTRMKCVIMKHKKIGLGKPAALVFTSGYLSVNGNCSISQARFNLRKFARLIQKIAFKVSLKHISIQSISCVYNMGFDISQLLGDIVKSIGGVYEPELFTAGCLKSNHVSFLLFGSGKIVITGLRNTQISMSQTMSFCF